MAPTIQPGDCIMIDRLGIVADGIEWLQNSKVYHIGIYVGNEMIVEATETGVEKNHISKYNSYKFNWMVRRVKDMNEKQTTRLIEVVTSFVKEKYSILQLTARIVFWLVKKITGKKFYKIIGQSEKDLIKCSELYCIGCIEAGVNLFPGVDNKEITPKMLYECDRMITVRTLNG